MVEQYLKKLEEDSSLSRAEKRIAEITYLKDEPSRDNRMGSILASLGGALAAGFGLTAVLQVNELSVLAALTGFGAASLAVGLGVRLVGAHRDGVGPIVAAILEHREDS